MIIALTGTGTKKNSNINHFLTNYYKNLGKITFAESLYGVANYYRGCWSADHWNNEVDYMIFDDIPWDEFENPRYGYPNKRDLLTGQEQLLVVYTSFHKVLINIFFYVLCY